MSASRPTTSAVVYLVRFAEGADAARRFLDSYRANPAGLDHRLVVLFKGFPGPAAKESWRQALAGLAYRELDFEDVGYDLTPYFRAAAVLEEDYFCFLNTFSRLLVPGWLALMHAPLRRPGVGLVGVTASYESLATNYITAKPGGWFLSRRARQRRRMKAHFALFPNYHVRSNGFLIPRDVARRVRLPPIRDKFDAWCAESGKQGLTAQVERMGLAAVIVGRDGVTYDRTTVWKSRTFRRDGQDNLLIADNQTDMWESAAPDLKRALTLMAWGDGAAG